MSGIRINNMDMFYVLWTVIAVLVSAYAYAAWRRRVLMERFVGTHLLERKGQAPRQVTRRRRAIFLVVAASMICIALTRPAWNPEPTVVKRRGRDVVFLLDVSRSMLAEDLAPNRLGQAKLAINDCIDRLSGDRIALVVFAGNSVIRCPLTLDYGFFRMMLDEVSTDSVARGGSMIGDALRKTLTEVFDDVEKKYKDIILITDGEDHGSFPTQAAQKADEMGIRLIVIGLGNSEDGERIPLNKGGKRSFLKHEGEEVWSRLDGRMLLEMANATRGGKYFEVATDTIDLGDVYARLIASAEKTELESATTEKLQEKFQVFLAMALLLIILEMVMSDRPSGRRPVSVASLLLLLALLPMSSVRADVFAEEIAKGNHAYDQGNYGEALDAYNSAAIEKPESPIVHFNMGVAHYKNGDYAKAAEMFRLAARTSPGQDFESLAKYNLGNATFKRAGEIAGTEPETALAEYESSTRHYRSALELKPDNVQAARNLEVARRTIRQLQEKLEKIKQQQESPGKNGMEQAINELADLAQRQAEALDQNKSLSRQQLQEPSDPGIKEKIEKLADTQKQLAEETEAARKNLETLQQEQPGSSIEEAQEDLDSAHDQQRQATDQLDEGDLSAARTGQATAGKKLKNALDALKRSSSEDQKQPGAPPEPDGKEPEQPDPGQKEPARELDDDARDLIKQEEDRKEQRKRASMVIVPVDKDW